jgi:hypothetical protein
MGQQGIGSVLVLMDVDKAVAFSGTMVTLMPGLSRVMQIYILKID